MVTTISAVSNVHSLLADELFKIKQGDYDPFSGYKTDLDIFNAQIFTNNKITTDLSLLKETHSHFFVYLMIKKNRN